MINIVAIGKKHEPWILGGVERYQKRLHGPWNVKWVLLPHSAQNGPTARQDESGRILLKLSPTNFMIVLDERGKQLDSPGLSKVLQQQIDTNRTIVVVIGGAYGISTELLERANLVWSLSPLVFPHQLVRLILAEQLYRAQQIAIGSPYHHE